MRIAMTIHALQGGGAERVFCRLAERWSTAGHEVHVVTWSSVDSDPGQWSGDVVRHGLDLLHPSRNAWQSWRANVRRIRVLRKTLSDLQPELVLSFCDQMNISTLRGTRGLNVPVWIAERSDPAQQQLGVCWEYWRRQNYPRCTGCVVQTQQIAEHLSKLIPRKRLYVIPNAVDIPPAQRSRLSPTNDSDSREGDAPRGVVLSVGRQSHEKGIDLLLDAWRDARTKLAGWQLHIVGAGPLRESFATQYADLSEVKFLGWQSDLNRYYAAATVFVLASRYEGFPNVLLEAMSHGVPSIATRCSQAVEQLARDDTAVMTIDINSPSQLAAAMVELAQNSQHRESLSDNALRVSQEYTWNRIGPLWDRLLGGTGVASGHRSV